MCYDVRFPELYRILALEGAELVTVPAHFTTPTGKDHWHVLLRARAIEDQCFVIASNQIGEHAPGIRSGGRSMIVDPWGLVLARAADRPCVIEAITDPEVPPLPPHITLEQARMFMSALRHGDPDRGAMIRRSFAQKLAGILPGQ